MRAQASGDPDEARADYEKVLALEPGNLVAIRALADLRSRAGDRAGFAEMLAAEARHGDDPARAADALVEAARLLELEGRPREETLRTLRGRAGAGSRPPPRRPGPLRHPRGERRPGRGGPPARPRRGPAWADGDPRELLRQLCRLGKAREHSGDASGRARRLPEGPRDRPHLAPGAEGARGHPGPGRGRAGGAAGAGGAPRPTTPTPSRRPRWRWRADGSARSWSGRASRSGRSESFERALEIDPVHVPSLRGMARSLLAREDWPRAVGRAWSGSSRIPEVQADHAGAARLHLQLGEVLRDRVGDEELSLHHLELALDHDSRLVKAFAAMEQILAGKRRWRDLARAIERMIARLPRVPETEKARAGLWKELASLQHRALGDLPAARIAYEQVVRDSPDDLDALQAYAELAAGVPGLEGVAADSLRSIALRQKDPSRSVSRLLAVQLARKDLDRAYAAADVLAHLLRTASPEELETVDRLRRLAREFATRSLDDVLWQRLLHERLRERAGPGHPLAPGAGGRVALRPGPEGPGAEPGAGRDRPRDLGARARQRDQVRGPLAGNRGGPALPGGGQPDAARVRQHRPALAGGRRGDLPGPAPPGALVRRGPRRLLLPARAAPGAAHAARPAPGGLPGGLLRGLPGLRAHRRAAHGPEDAGADRAGPAGARKTSRAGAARRGVRCDCAGPATSGPTWMRSS